MSQYNVYQALTSDAMDTSYRDEQKNFRFERLRSNVQGLTNKNKLQLRISALNEEHQLSGLHLPPGHENGPSYMGYPSDSSVLLKVL
jgi:hypothetical protein